MQTPNQNPAFEKHFSELYGARWPALKEALLRESDKAVLQNPFGLQNYSLDPASLLPIKHLDMQPGQQMADLCASPGGKTLAAMFALKGQGEWFANDLSPTRIQRLKAILHDCLPIEIHRQVHVSKGDASRWGMRYPESFDRALADVPCSGERHLLNSPKELARWTFKSSQRLTIRQHAILCAAMDCLKPGGRVVYSTCSISPIENDGVIEKLIKSRKNQFTVRPIQEEIGESTAQGWIVLPDTANAGPLYFSVLEKS